jgi:O-antigen ligase
MVLANTQDRRSTILSVLILLTGFTTGLFQSYMGIGAVGMAAFFITVYFVIVCVSQRKIILRLKNRLFSNMLLISVVLMIMGLMISTIISSSEWVIRVFPITIQYFFSYCIAYLFIASLNKRELELLLISYIVGGFVLAFLSIIIYLYAYDFGIQNLLIWRNGRLQMFSGANGLAPHMVLLSILLIYKITIKQLSGIYYLLLVIPLYVITLTGSNTGIILFIVAVFGLLAFVKGLKLKLILVMMAACGYLLLLNVAHISETYNIPVLKRFDWINSMNVEEAGTFQERSEAIRVAWLHVLNNPIIGVGAGAAGSDGVFVTQMRIAESSQAHNAYVLLWVEGGIVSIVGLLGWLLAIVFAGFSAQGKQRMFILVSAFTLALAISMRAHSYQLWLTLPIYLLIVMIFHERQAWHKQPLSKMNNRQYSSA